MRSVNNRFGKYNHIEFFSKLQIQRVQESLLKQHIDYCIENSKYYKKKLKHISPKKKINLDFLKELPFTTKEDIENHNSDFCAVDFSKIVDIVLSSGTTGKPTRIMYTDNDLARLAYNEAQSFSSCGLTSKDIVLLTCTLDRCFVAGLAYFLGIKQLGAAAIRNGLASLESHFQIIKTLNPSAIVGVPTFIRKLGIYLKQKGLDPKKIGVKKIICIGEPLRNQNMNLLKVGEDLEKIWNAKAYSTYASSETITTFCECVAQRGGHLHPDLAVIEIVDENGSCLPAGQVGEVVVTPLSIEGMPLVRFKTGDISFVIDEPCKCGRFSLRLGPILGRKKQMMKIKGTTVYPQAIYSALEEVEGLLDYYVSATSEADLSDKVTIYAALKDKVSGANLIQDKLQAKIRVKPDVVIIDEESIRKNVFSQESRKPIRFFDKRQVK